jgi:hypothetical protein
MAESKITLIDGLQLAAQNLREGAFYAWGHHGACNCGHLLQATSRLSKEEILAHAHTSVGEWTEIADEACPVTKAPVNLLISKLQELGLTPIDIHNLEYLEDRKVLQALPNGFRWLKRNSREDVIVYFETFAQLLQQQREKQTTVAVDNAELVHSTHIHGIIETEPALELA